MTFGSSNTYLKASTLPSEEGKKGNSVNEEKKKLPSPGWAHSAGLVSLGSGPTQIDHGLLPQRILIAERMYRYGWAFDERQEHALGECFTDDATWEANIMGVDSIGPHVGRMAILEFMMGFWPAQKDQRRHMIMNVIIESLNERSANVLCYHLLMSAYMGNLIPITAGFYRVEMLNENDVWKIHRLLAGYDLPF